MFSLCTDDVRRVLSVAQRHAAKLRLGAVGIEHLLLALIEYGRGAVEEAFFALDVTPSEAWNQLGLIVAAEPDAAPVEQARSLPYTPGATRVLNRSLDETRQLGTNYIGAEHLLLAILRQLDDPWAEPEPANEFLERLGVDLRGLRQEVLSRIPTYPDRPAVKHTESIRGRVSWTQMLFWMGGDP